MSLRDVKQTLDDLLHSGKAVDVSSRMVNGQSGHRFAIEAKTYERFVEWSSDAMRRHGVCLEPRSRLEAMLDACAYLATSGVNGGSFVCRAVDCEGDGRPQRTVFRMDNKGTANQPKWLIRV